MTVVVGIGIVSLVRCRRWLPPPGRDLIRQDGVRAGEITFHYADHGAGCPVLVLHGAGVDHREAEACFEPVFGGVAGFRRIYPDLPGMGRTIASEGLRGTEDVLDALLDFAAEITDGPRTGAVQSVTGGWTLVRWWQ